MRAAAKTRIFSVAELLCVEMMHLEMKRKTIRDTEAPKDNVSERPRRIIDELQIETTL
jgi:hypothetical protein